MTLSALPTCLRAQSANAVKRIKKSGLATSARATAFLLGLPLLGVLAGALFWVWRIADTIESPLPPPRAPFDFNLVQERYESVRLFASRNEVEALLGPPSRTTDFEIDPEFWNVEEMIEAHQRSLPQRRKKLGKVDRSEG